MATSIFDLIQDLTKEGVYADFVEIAKSLKLSTTSWQPGEPIRGLLAIFAEKISAYWNQRIAPAIRSGFLDTATGDWLTLRAWTTYRVRRKGARFATLEPLTLENRGAVPAIIVPGDIRVENSVTKVTFTNTTGGTLPGWPGAPAPFPTLDLAFAADTAGKEGDTVAGEILGFPTSPIQAPADVYAVENTAEAFGQDREEDDDLIERCRLKTGLLSPGGAIAGYEYVARSTRRQDGTDPERLLVEEEDDIACDVSRIRLVEGPGTVDVYLASPTGPATGDASTAGTDVYFVNIALQTIQVPAGITCNVYPAVALPLNFDLQVYVDDAANVTAADAKATALAALNLFFSKLPVGGARTTEGGQGYVFINKVEAAALAGAGVVQATCTPSTDQPVAPTEVVVPTLTVTVTLVKQS